MMSFTFKTTDLCNSAIRLLVSFHYTLYITSITVQYFALPQNRVTVISVPVFLLVCVQPAITMHISMLCSLMTWAWPVILSFLAVILFLLVNPLKEHLFVAMPTSNGIILNYPPLLMLSFLLPA